MEEQEARPTVPKKRGRGRHRYPPEQRKSVLRAFAAWKGTRKAFCLQHKVSPVTLWQWQREARGPKGKEASAKPPHKAKKGRREQTSYTPEQRRKAVETFNRSGQTLDVFGKTWGVNPTVLGRWVRAYRKDGPQALEGRRGRKQGRKPVAEGLREGIREVKEQFPDFGIRKVSSFLARFRGLKASHAAVTRVVKEEELPLGKAPEKRWRNKPVVRRFERSKPGDLWQTDITSFVLPRHSQRIYLVAFMDDFSRYVVAWKLGMNQTSDFVQEALLEGIQRFGKPRELLSDQGRQYFAWRGKSSFQKLLTKQGIQHVVSRAHHPETLGKCERFWGTVGEEFWSRVEPQELLEAQERLGHFINHYNHFRPHQGIGNAVPADRFFGAESRCARPSKTPGPKTNSTWPCTSPPGAQYSSSGQIGDQAVSLHGERGKLVLQTSEGVRQELVAHDLGMAQVFPPSPEKTHAGNHAATNRSNNGNAENPGESAETSRQAGGQTESRLQNGHPSVPSEGDLGAGERGRATGSPQDRGAASGALAGADDPQATRGQAEPADPQGLADEPTSAGRNGRGSDGPAEAAAEGDSDAEPDTEAGPRRTQNASQESDGPGERQQGLEGPLGPDEGHAWQSGAGSAEGEKNQPVEDPRQLPQTGSEPGSGIQAERGVTKTEPHGQLDEADAR